jgi:hypothetical protein
VGVREDGREKDFAVSIDWEVIDSVSVLAFSTTREVKGKLESSLI